MLASRQMPRVPCCVKALKQATRTRARRSRARSLTLSLILRSPSMTHSPDLSPRPHKTPRDGAPIQSHATLSRAHARAGASGRAASWRATTAHVNCTPSNDHNSTGSSQANARAAQGPRSSTRFNRATSIHTDGATSPGSAHAAYTPTHAPTGLLLALSLGLLV